MKKFLLVTNYLFVSFFSFAQNDSLNRTLQFGLRTFAEAAIKDAQGNIIVSGCFDKKSSFNPFIASIEPNGSMVYSDTSSTYSQYIFEHNRKLVATKDGGVLLGQYVDGCDFSIDSSSLTKFDAAGNLLWVNRYDDFNNLLGDFIELPDSTLLVRSGSAMIHLTASGTLLSSNFLLGYFNEMKSWGNGKILTFYFDSLKTYDSNYNLLDANYLPNQHYIRSGFNVNDSLFFVESDSTIFKLDTSLQILSSYKVNGLIYDLKQIDGAICVLRDRAPQLLRYDLNFLPLDSFDLVASLDTFTIPTILVDGFNEVYVISEERNNVAVKSFSKTNFTSVKKDFDASVLAVTCDSTKGTQSYTSVWTSYLCGKFKVLVKNTGTTIIDSLWLNCLLYFYPGWCVPSHFSQRYTLTLLPGDTAELNVGWLEKVIPYQQTNQMNVCFYTSSPNHKMDAQPANDELCSTLTISNILIVGIDSQKSDKMEISVFPNPASNQLTIESTLSNRAARVFTLYNFAGELVLENSVTSSSASISIENLANGIYYFELKESSKLIVRNKLIIQH